MTGGAGSTKPPKSGGTGSAGAGARKWEPVVGLEIHAQLKTRTKMFCRCANGFGGEPNTQTCTVCLGFPGALPVPNRTAIEWTIKLGLALGCEIRERAVFARKHYPYPDLPKGYQISQYDMPSCVNGKLLVPTAEGDQEITIVRAHLEEDAAKITHVGGRTGRIGGADHSLIDFNRGGTPLVEIVTGPDVHSSDEARRFLQLLRQTIVEVGISDAEMEKGELRVDANVSVRPAGSTELRTRCELKNMNSFRFVAQGIDAEVARQVAIYEAGGEVVQETYDFDAASGTLTARRGKEEADDYRYFPEPDLVPVEPTKELIERLRGELPELPAARIRRLEAELDLDRAVVLVTGGLDRLWEATVAAGAEGVAAANVIANRMAGTETEGVDAAELATLVEARDRIPRTAFDEALGKLRDPGFSAAPYLVDEAVSDTAELEPIVVGILDANPGQVEAYRGGKEGLLGFFVGQVMKETGGKANARVVSELVREKLRVGA